MLLTVSGPGAVHAIAGVSHAATNCWPMLLLSGSAETVSAGAFQHVCACVCVNRVQYYSVCMCVTEGQYCACTNSLSVQMSHGAFEIMMLARVWFFCSF